MSSIRTYYPNHAGTGKVKVVYAWTDGYSDEITVYCRDTATVTPVINSSSFTYDGNNKTLVTTTTSSHVSTFYIGYKKGSQATADSQITWMSANATTITAKDAGTYYIYYKATGATDYCNIPYTLKGSKAIACASAYATAGNISTYVTYSTSSQTITLPIASNSGTVTFPSSVSATNTNTNTSYTWSCNSSGTVTIPANQGSGSYTITATVSIAASSNGNYCSGSKSLTWYSAINCQTYDANIYVSVGSTPSPAGSSVPYGQQINHVFICGIPGTLFWDTEENWVQNGYVGNTLTYSGSNVGQMVYFAPMTVTASAGTNKTTIRACFVPNDTTRYCIAGGDYMYAGLDFWVTVSKADNPVTLSPASSSTNRIKLYANHDNCTINTKTITVNNLQGTVTSVTSSDTNVVSIGSYSNSSIKLDYVGNGTATITVSITGNTNYLGTTKYIYVECKTDTELSTEYKNEACTQTGYNVTSYGTPSVSIGSGLTAGGGSATVTCSVTNTSQWYQKWESGCVKSHTGNKTGTAKWRITSNGNNRFSHPSSGGSTITVGGSNVTVYASGTSVSHSSMTTNVATDSVTVTAYNIGDTTKSATAEKSVTNAVTNSDYNASNSNYTASVSIGNGLTCAGGSATVTTSGSHTHTYYYYYTSGSTSGPYTSTPSDTVTWSITTQTFTPSGGSASTITRFSKSGNTLSHSSMGTNVGTDYVKITATNAGNSNATATADKSISNAVTNSDYNASNSNYTASVSIGDGLTAAGGSATVTTSGSHTHTYYYLYCSGSTSGPYTSTVSDGASWSITTQTFTPSGGSASTITRFSKSGNTLSHSSMGTNVGTDYVKITATNAGNSNATATADKSISNAIITTQKYKNTSGTTGYNITYVTPTVSISDGLTAAGGSATVTCSVTNNTDWYYKYNSGSYTGNQTGTEAGTARWRITSNGNNRFSHPSSGGSTLNVGGTNVTVYNTGTSVSHSSMTTNVATDSVTVTAYNIGDTSKSATASKSVSNSLGTDKYKNTTGTTGYNVVYTTPSVSIGSGITAAGGSATVTCSVTNNTNWYQKYTSGSYTGQQTGTETGTARWRITSNGNSAFSEPSSGGSTLNVGGSNVTVYNTGTSVTHSNMTTNARTDSVTVTAYNIGDTTKSATAEKSITNSKDNTNYSPSNYTASVSIGGGLTAGGGSATVTASASHLAYDYYTSGSYNNQHNVSDSVSWVITTQTFTPSGGSASTITRFSKSGNTLSHSSMTGNVGTDYVKVTATNGSSSSATATAEKSITNTLLSTKYKNTSGTTGYNVVYTTPSVSIGSGLTAAGGSATVTCSVTNNTNWYQKYDSGTYTSQYTGTEAGTATWDITTQTFTPSGGSASTITRFSKSGNTLSHSSMTSNVGTDYVKVTATNSGDSSKTATAEKSITNTLPSTKYKNTSGTTGYNVEYVTPQTCTIGSGLTAAGGSATVTCSVTNNTNWYQKYDSGTYTSQYTGTEAGTARWRITSNGNSAFSEPSSGGSTLNVGGSNVTVYNTGTSVTHSNMTTNARTDSVTVTAYNIGDTTKTKTATASVTNSLGTQKYKNTTGTTGYNVVYTTPTVSIGSGITADGGSATVTCSVTNNTNWYQKYTSGSYTGQQTGTEAGTATWAITSQTYTSQIASAVNITRFSKSGNTLSHTTMDTNVGKDYVVITATNSGDSSKTATTNTTVKNKVTLITPKSDQNDDTTHFRYSNIGAGATSAPVTTCGGALYTLSTGSTIFDSSGSPAFGGTASYSRTYSLSASQNGFTAVNSSGTLTATSRGCDISSTQRCSGTVTSVLTVTYTHTSVLDSTVVTSSTKTSTATCCQAANTITAYGAVGKPTITQHTNFPCGGVTLTTSNIESYFSHSSVTQTVTLASGCTTATIAAASYTWTITTGTVASRGNTLDNNTTSVSINIKVTANGGGSKSTNSDAKTSGTQAANPISSYGAVGKPTISQTTNLPCGGVTLTTSNIESYFSHSSVTQSVTLCSGETTTINPTGYTWTITTGEVASRGNTLDNNTRSVTISIKVTANGGGNKSTNSDAKTSATQAANPIASYGAVGTPTITQKANFPAGGVILKTSNIGTYFNYSTVTQSVTLCSGSTTTIAASGYSWSGNDVTIPSLGTTVTSQVTTKTISFTITASGGGSKSSSATVTSGNQDINALTGITFTVNSNSISYGGNTTGTVTASYTSGSTKNVSNDTNTSYTDDGNPDIVSFTKNS